MTDLNKIINEQRDRIAELERELDELKPLIQFVDGCIECCFDGCSYDGADMQDNLVETGVLVVETYCRDKHGIIDTDEDIEEGDNIYLIAPWFSNQISQQLNGGEK